MKQLTLLFAFLLVNTFAFAQTTSDKTLVKTLNAQECPNVKIDIKNKGIESKSWDEGTVRVELEVKANIPDAVLAQLIKAGRYTIEGGKDEKGETFIVFAPNLEKSIMVGGKDLEEVITITVQTPGYFAMNDGLLSKDIDETAVAARSENAEEAAATIKKMKAIKENLDMQVNVVSTSKYKGKVDLATYEIVVDGQKTTADKISFETEEGK